MGEVRPFIGVRPPEPCIRFYESSTCDASLTMIVRHAMKMRHSDRMAEKGEERETEREILLRDRERSLRVY